MSEQSVQARPIPRLKTRYAEEVAPALMKEFGDKHGLQLARVG